MEQKTVFCMASGVDFERLPNMVLDKTADLACLGYCGVTINYLAELTNMACEARELSYLSSALEGVLAAGVVTDLYGEKRKSVAVFDKGRLLNISDMVNTDGTPFLAGNHFSVYKTSIGRVGIVVDADIYQKPVAALAAAGSSLVVCTVDAPYSSGLELMLKCQAYGNCRIFCTTQNISVVVDVNGNIVHESSGMVFF